MQKIFAFCQTTREPTFRRVQMKITFWCVSCSKRIKKRKFYMLFKHKKLKNFKEYLVHKFKKHDCYWSLE
jgi:hypothetical protein